MFTTAAGADLTYYDSPYNRTRLNERAIEIPLAFDFILRSHGEGLEVGNVLSHYMSPTWPIVDKFEQAPGVRNVDVLKITGQRDWIISISTLEHVGQDEPDQDPTKPMRAVAHLRSLLRPFGKLFVTVPTGWNPTLDEWLPSAPADASFYRRIGDEWVASDFAPLPYDHENQTATGLWVGEFECA